jgi:cysteine desulfurase
MRHQQSPNLGIYLDHQASTPADSRVVAAMMPYFIVDYANPHSSEHSFGWRAADAVEYAREQVARVIGADPAEVVFTSGATEANNLAILGAARAASSDRRRIVISAIEHRCVLEAAAAARSEGFEVVRVAPRADGLVEPDAVARAVDGRTAIVSIMTLNNEIGTVQPIADIAVVARQAGALFHTDASQALSVLPLSVHELGVDLLSLSAHKAYGPKGVGALYVRAGVRVRPLMYGGGQEGGLRPGTLPVPLCVGLGEACAIAMREWESDAARLRTLSSAMLAMLRRECPDLRLNGSWELRHPGNLNVTFPEVDADLLISALQPRLGISSGSACSNGMPEPSHVLLAIGLSPADASASLRIGLGRQTTAAQVQEAAALIAAEARRIKQQLTVVA